MPEPIIKPTTTFVGREPELYQLHQSLQNSINSPKSEFVLIGADYGLGKTTLVEHFLAEVSSQSPHILIGGGRCAMEKESSGLVPFAQLLTSLKDQSGGFFAAPDGFLNFAKEVAPAWLDIVTGGAASATVKTFEEGRKLLGSNAFSQENVFVQFTNALSHLAEKQPVIAFIDDLHWADTSSLGLLFHTARNLQNRAVLFIITYRPVEAMETSPNASLFRDIRANLFRYGAVELEIKQGLDVSQYIAQRYPINTFSPDLIKLVQKLTGGHALFVSQVFSLWEENKTITFSPTSNGLFQWSFADHADTSLVIPQTLSEVLAERIRSLADELRETLVCASVEGDDFTLQTIARIRQLNEIKVSDSLELLDNHYYLIEDDGTKQIGQNIFDFYRFTHRFFRDHIYNQLSTTKKRILHKQVAECLEALYSDRSEIAGRLAHHFREASDLMKSAQYALMAAQFEQSRYAWDEVESWHTFGIELIDKLPSDSIKKQLQFDLLEQSGSAYFFCGKYTNAYERCYAALALTKEFSLPADQKAKVYVTLGKIREAQGINSEAMMFIQAGLQVLKDQGESLSDIYFELERERAWMEYRLDHYNIAVDISHKILKDAENLPYTPSLETTIAWAYDILSTALSCLNQYDDALIAIQNMLKIAENIPDGKDKALFMLEASWRYFSAGNINKCMEFASKGQAIALKIGDLDDVALSKNIIADVLIARGKFEDALVELSEAIALSEKIDALYDMPHMCANMAVIYLALANNEKAYQFATRSVNYAKETSISSKLGKAFDVLAQVEAANQSWDLAKHHFNQAIDYYQQAGNRHYMARSQYHLAEMLIAQGNRPEAIRLLEKALQVFHQLRLSDDAKKTEERLNSIGM